ncbi:hypothetical protein J1614_003418 [Plenodomus biglobosus]|nr:hypothetical protein J1614_003418 [Plenodomus biglobosus]
MSPQLALHDALEFQYCRKQKCPAKRTTSPFLGGVAIRHRYECTGIRHCEYLDNSLAILSHTCVTEDIWEQLKGSRTNAYRSEQDERKRSAIVTFQAVQFRFRNQTACTVTTRSCRPILKTMQHADVSGEKLCYVGCAGSTADSRRESHFFRIVGNHVDYEYLENLFQTGIQHEPESTELCSNIFSTKTRYRECGSNHPQGRGKLVWATCNVEFDIIIPVDLVKCPYYIFTSTGTHVHPPPPPTKPIDSPLEGRSTEIARQKRKRSAVEEPDNGDEDDTPSQASLPGYLHPQGLSPERQMSVSRSSPAAQSITTESGSQTSSQPFLVPPRPTSAQSNIQPQVLQQNRENWAKHAALELREREARVRRQELENRLLELELLQKERALARQE